MKKIKVLSLFDGISCGQQALKNLGIEVDTYFASEIKKCAINNTKKNHPNTIHIGDVAKISYKDGVLSTECGEFNVNHIDLILAGSPCQNFSSIGNGLGLDGEKSKLFFEFYRLLKEINPTYFLLENVKMSKVNKKKLDDFLGVSGIQLNSNLVSYQNRPRIYWTNIPGIKTPNDQRISFQDYRGVGDLEQAKVNRTPSRERMWNYGLGYEGLGTCDNITCKDKIRCLTRKQDRSPNSGLIEYDEFCRFLTRNEMELAQTLPIGYTDGLSYNEAQDVLGDGWTVKMIEHILSFMK